MDIIRNFKLVANNGATVELLGTFGSTPFFNQPDGLGFEYDLATAPIYNAKIITSISNTFANITGELIFKTYDEYNRFKYFVQNNQNSYDILFDVSKTLKLYYAVNDKMVQNGTYFEVFVNKIGLSEKDQNGMLICPVIFERLSNLKENIVKIYQNQLDFEYPDTYPLPTPTSNYITYGNNNSTVLSFDLNNSSNLEIQVYFEISGEYHNPTFVNKTTGNSGGYFVEEQNGILVVDPYFPQKMTSNGVDMSNQQDYSKDNFLVLKTGTNSVEFNVSPNQPITATSTITVRYYREVE